jgi:magnesium-protoporphyrin O-methyltransferase
MTLLDIGGGLGGIQHALLKRGVVKAIHVDASSAYLQAAREEAQGRNLADKIVHLQGDFTELAKSVPGADLVTLDRVVCCYDDMQALIRMSAQKAGRKFGLVFPRDLWLFKIFLPLVNFIIKLRGSSFRIFLHNTQQIDNIIRSEGLGLESQRKAGFWQVFIYHRK